MFGSEILDVAIGVVLMFLATSLISSAVNELVEAFLKNRARDLERGIRELLGDSSPQGLVQQFYTHPLISGLFRGNYSGSSAKNLPSYIPARTFALALMDLIQPGALNSSSGASATTPPGNSGPGYALPISLGRGLVQQFRQSAAALPASPLRSALLPLIDASGDDPSAARQNIEDWYNAAMDRVSGWYKRRTQFILVGIGFAVAGLMNADTISLARHLSTSKAARDVVVASATTANSKGPAGLPTGVSPTLEWIDSVGGLPLGWRTPPGNANLSEQYKLDPQRFPQTPSEAVAKLVGFLITALAVSLGAPFWFDVLNQFMVVRSTVKPQEKSPQEAGKN